MADESNFLSDLHDTLKRQADERRTKQPKQIDPLLVEVHARGSIDGGRTLFYSSDDDRVRLTISVGTAWFVHIPDGATIPDTLYLRAEALS